MQVKMILPALTEALSPFWRPIKYHLFPPLGLATIAAFFAESDQICLQDEHVEPLNLNDEPDLVVIQVYITSAYRAYEIADHYRSRGVYVVLGGLHVTSLPLEAAQHADTIFLGPGEDTWPQFLADFRQGKPQKIYQSKERSLVGVPPVRRDLIKRHLYLVPNSIVVSRGCPHHCDFCYKDAFYQEGKSFYTQPVDAALAEIYKDFGVETIFNSDNSITISKERIHNSELRTRNSELNNSPDIAQTIAVTCFGLGMGCHLTGLHTLKIKETDRLEALKTELTKLGAKVLVTNDSLTLENSISINENIVIATCQDHRMAMAFAPLALKVPMQINEAEVVSKSYPDFWEDLKKVGFSIKEL